jgi:hypothetical protein
LQRRRARADQRRSRPQHDAEVTRRAVEAEGRRCLVIQGDVSKRSFCFDAVARTVKVIVNNVKRPAQPEEISPAFVFPASPQCSSYITGEILPVIGGYGH